MFRSSRGSYSGSSSSSSDIVDVGSFVFRGVSCNYSIYGSSSSGYRVKVSYDKADVPWLDRESFERGVEYAVKRDLSGYNIRSVTVYG